MRRLRQPVLLGKMANEIFADVRVKRNHVVQHYHSVHFRATHHKRFIFGNAKSHCSLIWRVTCPRLILETERKRKISGKMSLRTTIKITITYLKVPTLNSSLTLNKPFPFSQEPKNILIPVFKMPL